MILSVSRRTDIPHYYAEWFYRRIAEGFVYVRNPFHFHQIRAIDLSPEVVDCMVFWTKNPQPMMGRLHELSKYEYYFQFTLTGYGTDVECRIPHKREQMLPIFQALSRQIGSERIVWRYDPILFTPRYTPGYHLRAFEQIASALSGCTDQCVISFVDVYVKNKKNLASLGAYELKGRERFAFAKALKEIAEQYKIAVCACAEEGAHGAYCDAGAKGTDGPCSFRYDLAEAGIFPSACIDKGRIERLLGGTIQSKKEKNQRRLCNCIESIEIGAYDTCPGGCKYCYANANPLQAMQRWRSCDPGMPLLCGQVEANEQVSRQTMRSLRMADEGGSQPEQMTMRQIGLFE